MISYLDRKAELTGELAGRLGGVEPGGSAEHSGRLAEDLAERTGLAVESVARLLSGDGELMSWEVVSACLDAVGAGGNAVARARGLWAAAEQALWDERGEELRVAFEQNAYGKPTKLVEEHRDRVPWRRLTVRHPVTFQPWAEPHFTPGRRLADPALAADIREFYERLADLKTWAGSPRQSEIEKRSWGVLPDATVSAMLQKDRWRSTSDRERARVAHFAAACGLPAADVARWQSAYDRLRHILPPDDLAQARAEATALRARLSTLESETATLRRLLTQATTPPAPTAPPTTRPEPRVTARSEQDPGPGDPAGTDVTLRAKQDGAPVTGDAANAGVTVRPGLDGGPVTGDAANAGVAVRAEQGGGPGAGDAAGAGVTARAGLDGGSGAGDAANAGVGVQGGGPGAGDAANAGVTVRAGLGGGSGAGDAVRAGGARFRWGVAEARWRRVLMGGGLVAVLVVGVVAGRMTGGGGDPECFRGTLRLLGSTAFERTAQALAEAYERRCGGADVIVNATGSNEGVRALNDLNARTAIAMHDGHLRADSAEMRLRGFEGYPIALIAFAVIVHKDTGITDLPVTALRDLYAGRRPQENWKRLGGADVPVRLVSRTEGSGTRAIFEERVLREAEPAVSSDDCLRRDEIRAEAPIIRCERSSQTQVLEMVDATPGAIGYAELHNASDAARYPNLRIITLNGRRPEVSPSTDRYPFVAPEVFYTYGFPANGTPVSAFLTYLRGRPATELLQRSAAPVCTEPSPLLADLCQST